MTRLTADPAPVAESVPFVELSRAVSEPAAPSLGAGELEVLLPGGVRIRWKG